MIEKDIELIRKAVGTDGKEVAYKRGKSESFLKKQFSADYLNFWTNTKKWITAFAEVNMSKAELFFKDFDLLKRKIVAQSSNQSIDRVVIVESDVAEYFPTSESVNEALRFLIRITKQHKSEQTHK